MIVYQNKKSGGRSIKYGYRFKTAINSVTTTTTNNTTNNTTTTTNTNNLTTTTIPTTTILIFIIPIILLFFSSSLLAESSNIATMSFAQISTTTNNSNNSNNGYSTFPNSGLDTDRAPAFLDAYWTNYLSSSSTAPSNANSVKKEVGPGDGTSTLAVVLVNSGRSDITGVTGYLNMPSSGGFTSIEGKNNGTNQSIASAYYIVKSGNTFVLYFDMNVLKQAKVGGYSTSLTLKYTKINQIGQLSTTITVPFRLTGKVILDAVSENSQLIPSASNQLKILIKNKGTATASSVIATVTGITSASGQGGSVINSANSGSNSSSSSTGTASSPPSSSTTAAAVNIGPTTFNIGTLPGNNSIVEINPVVYPSVSAGGTTQNMNIQITYGDAYGNQQIYNIPIGLVISPNPPQSVLNVTSNNGNALIITAGKIQDMNLTLANSDTKRPITNVVATLSSSSSSIKMLGDSRWTFQSMSPQSKISLPTKVFASTNVVGLPAVFTLTVDYILAGQSKTDTLNIGTYVKGDIKVSVYGVGINFIGGIPNIVGNILNEGNIVGLFTSVQMVKSNSSQSFISQLPPYQYLGDLSVDSPLPFSIPINADNKTMAAIKPGIYPIALRITYSDDLKIQHQLIVNSLLDYEPIHSQGKGNSHGGFGGIGSSSIMMVFLAIVIVAVAIILLLLFVRRRRRRNRNRNRNKSMVSSVQNRKDSELFLDDVSSLDPATPSSFATNTNATDKDSHGL